MDLIQLIVILVMAGVALWFINAYIPMQPTVKKILNVVVVFLILLFLFRLFFGGFGNLGHIHVGRIN